MLLLRFTHQFDRQQIRFLGIFRVKFHKKGNIVNYGHKYVPDMIINYILSLKVSTAYYSSRIDESKFILELLTFPGIVHSCPCGVACPKFWSWEEPMYSTLYRGSLFNATFGPGKKLH